MLPGEVIPYEEMCRREAKRLQKGMNFHRKRPSVFLMSRRHDALYRDRIEEEGRVLIYQGHDDRPSERVPEPRAVDQPLALEGKPTDNGKFREAALAAKHGAPPHQVRVYEKLLTGVWVYNGTFELLDSWMENDGKRRVCVFKLRLMDEAMPRAGAALEHSRVIPPDVKAAVWARDHGACVTCGATTNLHFDHILPYSKGGTSLLPENIQLLCARHNIEKSDRIAG